MIRFENVCKAYPLKTGRKVVLDHVSIDIPPLTRLGILGLNGAGKSTLMRLFAGGELPDSGRVYRNGRISFPVGFTGTFFHLQSGRENVKFLARIYGMNEHEVAAWVEDFSELGHYYDMPVGTYSSGMHTRIAFATSFAFDFDFYLVDEAFETGDKNFRQKCVKVFENRLQEAGLVLISHNMRTIRDNCNAGALLHNGKIHMHATVDETIVHYEQILRDS